MLCGVDVCCTTLYANVARISVAADARLEQRPKWDEHLLSCMKLLRAAMKCLTRLNTSAKARKSCTEWILAPLS